MTGPTINADPSVSAKRVDWVVRLVDAASSNEDARYAIVCAAANILGTMAGQRGEADIDAALAGFRDAAHNALLAHLPPGGRA